MNPSHILLSAGGLLLAGVTATAQSYLEVPGSWGVNDITPDGTVVCGVGPSGGFYWRWQTDPAPTFIDGNDAVALSDDGSVIVGCINDPSVGGAEVAAMWTQATGWVSLGYLPGALSCPSRSNAFDVSGDGSTVIGLSWEGCNGYGFIWTQATGMLPLENLANGTNRASVIAADGSLIGGFAQGTQNRTPALWLPDQSGQVYNVDDIGEVRGLSNDGSIAVGEYNGEGFYDVGQGPVLIGSLNGPFWTGAGMDVSEDGDRIVGFDVLNLTLVREATIWSQATGWESLRDKLVGLGVAVPDLHVALAQTPDGEIIVGHNSFQGWIVTLPRDTETYCTAKTNSQGCSAQISSTGFASASDDSPFQVDASMVISQKNGLLFFGFGQSNIAFQGGILCVQPPLRRTGIQFSGGTTPPDDCTGSFTLDFNALIQSGSVPQLQPGAQVYAQYWYRDPADPTGFGIGLSDALGFLIQG